MTVRCRVAYFGYSVEFTSDASATVDRRAEANQHIITKFGAAPAMRYVVPGLPFPDYVPVMTWGEVGNADPQEYGFA